MRDGVAGSPDAPPSKSQHGRRFVEPPWSSPLDPEAVIAAIPKQATISGMFFSYLIAGAKAQGVTLPSARERYTQFQFYPVADLARLHLEASTLMLPRMTVRQALRAMGRPSSQAYLTSTLGKVTLGSTQGVMPAIEAISNAYQNNVRPSAVTVVSSGPNWAVLRMERVYHFLDSHHVGVLEGVLEYAKVTGSVKIAPGDIGHADFLLTWEG